MDTRASTGSHDRTGTGFNPLGDYLDRFQQHLVGQGYANFTVRQYLNFVGVLAARMGAEQIALDDLDEARAVELVVKAGWSEERRLIAIRMVKRFVRFAAERGAGRSAVRPTPKEIALADLRRDYEAYLRNQRGLCEKTIFVAWRFAERFLEYRFGPAPADLSRIAPDDIAGFLQHLISRKPPFRDKTAASHLRNFFRYLFKASKTPSNLSLGIPSVAQRYGARLPRHLTPEQVEVVIRAVRTDRPEGKRNLAMVLLLARLGLRAPEVIAMRIDDINWRAGEIVVRGKGGRHDRLPLPPDVGEALASYIRFDRVTSSRTLFVTGRAPHGPFKNGALLNAILRTAFARTGLKPPTPYVGAHILRHSLATNLVRHGASLEEIGETLRHRSRRSTMIYAKLDIDGLRSLALPWPVAGGAQ